MVLRVDLVFEGGNKLKNNESSNWMDIIRRDAVHTKIFILFLELTKLKPNFLIGFCNL